jgi:hypothetical protein
MTLLGGTRGELRVPADILLETVGALLEGARQATRFFVEGESTRKGPRPAWLDAACNVEVTGLTAGSAVVTLEARTLVDAAPDCFGGAHQVSLFAEPQITIDTGSTAVDIFASVLASVIQGDRERVLADRTLLDTCVRFARSVRDGFDGIQLEGIAGLDAPLVVRRNDVARIELLRDETPGPKAVRVTGMLDTISATKADVVLTLTDGTAVAARLDARDNEQLKSLFGTRVVVAGLAQFRPSGKLLVIDVEYLGPARSLATWCSRACRTPRQSPLRLCCHKTRLPEFRPSSAHGPVTRRTKSFSTRSRRSGEPAALPARHAPEGEVIDLAGANAAATRSSLSR